MVLLSLGSATLAALLNPLSDSARPSTAHHSLNTAPQGTRDRTRGSPQFHNMFSVLNS